MADQAYSGDQRLASATSEYNRLDFVVRAIVGKMATATLVQVVKVDTAKQTVDLHPMVAQIDGEGKATPHGTVFNVPFTRAQGGRSAVILDPKVGDVGVAIFASHDISSVKKTRKPGNPGSRRRFDFADALYLGGVLNDVPSQYLRLDGRGAHVEASRSTFKGNAAVGSGATGSFTTPTGQTVTVRDGIITNII